MNLRVKGIRRRLHSATTSPCMDISSFFLFSFFSSSFFFMLSYCSFNVDPWKTIIFSFFHYSFANSYETDILLEEVIWRFSLLPFIISKVRNYEFILPALSRNFLGWSCGNGDCKILLWFWNYMKSKQNYWYPCTRDWNLRLISITSRKIVRATSFIIWPSRPKHY